jgi:enoyl-CoA hydratase
MRNDRASAIAQWDLPVPEALRSEYRFGVDSLRSPDAVAGAAGFAAGAGRGGATLRPDGR